MLEDFLVENHDKFELKVPNTSKFYETVSIPQFFFQNKTLLSALLFRVFIDSLK